MSARVLVVEDEVVVAMNLEARLRELGYEVTGTVGESREAVRIAEQTHPDIVLMDIRLKGDIDGIDTAQEISGRLRIPVVYLTAYADDETLKRAKITEPFGYVLKPFGIRELHATIEMALYRARTQQELLESREWLSTTLTSIREAVVATDSEGHIRFMNPAAERLTGWNQGEALGLDVDSVLRLLTPRAEPVGTSSVRTALTTGEAITEDTDYLLVTKSGDWVPIVDGAAPIKNARDEVTGAVVACRDMTERKRIEGELIRSNAEIQQFAYAAAHDLQEPLRTVTAYIELLDRSLKGSLDNEQQQLLNTALDGCGRMRLLVAGLLDYGRMSHAPVTLRCFPSRESVESAIASLRAYIEERRALITHGPLPVVMADAEQLTEVFQNLISNGIKYQPADRPRVRITAEQQGEDYVFCVADDGIGIAPRHHDEVFRVFKRLHAGEYPGSGMGLSIAKRIVERHRGNMWVASEEGQGARFFFSLPIQAASLDLIGAGRVTKRL